VRLVERRLDPVVQALAHRHTDVDRERLELDRRDVLDGQVVGTHVDGHDLGLDVATIDVLQDGRLAIEAEQEVASGI
jgi:hypothetical protein